MKRGIMEKRDRVVVIGGGIAGLSAGIYALKAGFECTIYEKNAIPGGECIGWNRKGFHIDNCIHWLTGTKKGTDLYEVWETVGALSAQTVYAPLDSFYSSVEGGQTVTLWSDLKRTERELLAVSPEDEEEIRKFIRYVEYSKQCIYPAEKPMEMWGIRDYIAMGKEMADFPKVMKELGKCSIEDYSKRFRSPLLRKLLCDYLPKEYGAISLLVSYASIADGNGKVPMGASLQLSLRMEKKFKELGGEIFYNRGVEEIVVEKKKAVGVRLADGRLMEADYIIPAMDFYPLFHRLLPREYMPAGLRKAYEKPEAYPVTSGFQVAYAVDEHFACGETVFVDIEPLKVGSRTFDRMYVKAYGYDPVCVKDGRQVLQTCITQTDEDYRYWKTLSKAEYKEVKEKLVQEITRRIAEKYPELAGKMEVLDAWTPLTYERYCGAYHGGYMSFITKPGSKKLKVKGKVKKIRNLYLAGQWTTSPGGLPVAVTSGKFAVQRILKSQKRDIAI